MIAKNDAKEAKKQTSNTPPTAKLTKQKGDEDNIVINDEKIEMGDMIIDENGIRDKKTGKFILTDSADGESKSLTPQRINRLKRPGERMEDRKKRIVIKPPPAPPIPQATP